MSSACAPERHCTSGEGLVVSSKCNQKAGYNDLEGNANWMFCFALSANKGSGGKT